MRARDQVACREHNTHANSSYWNEFLKRRFDRASLWGNAAADAVVVGGGLTGLLTAYWLACHSEGMRIVVLEKDEIGQGASGRNAGMILPRPHLQLESLFSNEVIQFTYRELSRAPSIVETIENKSGYSFDLQRTRFFALAFNEKQRQQLVRTAAKLQMFGAPCSFTDSSREFPHLALPLEGILEYRDAATINPGRFLCSLRHLLSSLGVIFLQRASAISITDGTKISVATSQVTIDTPWVVVATPSPVVCHGPCEPWLRTVEQVSFAILTEPLPSDGAESVLNNETCVTDIRGISNYARRYDNRILFGGRMGFYEPSIAPASAKRLYEKLSKELSRWFPSLRHAQITHQWHGVIDMSPLEVPVIERHLRGRMIRICGYSGLGLAESTVCSRAAADIITGNGDRWADLAYFKAVGVGYDRSVSTRRFSKQLAAMNAKVRNQFESFRNPRKHY